MRVDVHRERHVAVRAVVRRAVDGGADGGDRTGEEARAGLSELARLMEAAGLLGGTRLQTAGAGEDVPDTPLEVLTEQMEDAGLVMR